MPPPTSAALVRFDLLGCQNRLNSSRGIARYVKSLALAIEAGHPDFVDQYLVHPDLPLPSGIEPLIASGKVVRVDRLARHRGPGLFLGGSPFEDFALSRIHPLWARARDWRTMFVLYDLIPALFPNWYLQDRTIRLDYGTKLESLRSVDRLLAISRATAADAERFGIAANRLAVIGAGVDPQFVRPAGSPRSVARELAARGVIAGLTPDYVLLPSGVDARKNIEATIEAFAQLPAHLKHRYQLVLVCEITAEYRRFVEQLADDFGVANRFIATGYVDDVTLASLYQGATAVVFPSLYEGFGLPVLEAMSCGAPVICADNSSLVEIQTDPRARFDAGSRDAITAALTRVLDDDDFRAELAAQPLPGFTWARAAEGTVAAGRALLDDLARRTARAPARRPTLALVSPWPPQASGIATYAKRLVAELRSELDVTVFVDRWQDDLVPMEGVTLAPTSTLVAQAESGIDFDHVLYFMGNSEFHQAAFEALRLVPGNVLLHDVRFTGLYAELYRNRRRLIRGGSVGATLQLLYPQRYHPALAEMAVVDAWDAERYGIYLTAELARGAERVLVHSRFAAELVELDAGCAATVIYPMPVAVPEPAASAPALAGPALAGSALAGSAPAARAAPAPGPAEPEAPTISTFGQLGPAKHPELLLSAFVTVARELPGARLRFVGHVPAGYEAELWARVPADLRDRVAFTGFVDDDGYRQALRDTTIAVQLRRVTNGESSAAVADLIGAGVPVIVNGLGPMAELDDGVVLRLPGHPTVDELGRAMIDLLGSPARRDELRREGLDYTARNSFAAAARRLVAFLGQPDQSGQPNRSDQLGRSAPVP